MKNIITTLLLSLMFTLTFAGQDTGLLRFPAVHNDQLVFSYAGDLYTVAATGGYARKLTSHKGFELFARFSPDGKQIAFTGQYDGNTEVFLIPATGGTPKRLTYTATLGRDDVSDRMGPNNIVMTWKNDSTIVFRSRMREPNDFNGQLYTVTTAGDLPVQIPVPRGGFCSFSPDGKKMAYNRIFREFRTWKKYRGGMADDIWILGLDDKKLQNITANPAQDIIPMWHGEKIYFLSDRDDNKRMNLFVYNTATRQTRKLTDFVKYDIKFPSLGPNSIVFENGGFIHLFDLETEKASKITIHIADDQITGRHAIESVKDQIRNYEISPAGKRALFGARGEIFTVPAENGPIRNITGTPGVHERNAKWSPDGQWIAFISDETGGDQIFLLSQTSGKKHQLTKGSVTYKYNIKWSPDSKKLLWSDRDQLLRYVDINTKEIRNVAKAKVFEIRQYVWSPDSKWIAWAKPEDDIMNTIQLYSLEQDKSFPVTDGWYNSSSPCFSDDGKYLFFTSDRIFNPSFSQTEWNHAFFDMTGIYFTTMSAKTESPFKPKSDEVEPQDEKADDKKDEEKKDEKAKKTEPLLVDTGGLTERILGLGLEGSNYGGLACVDGKLYYIRNGRKDDKNQMFYYDLKKLKQTELGQIDGYEISADRKKMLVGQAKQYAIIDLPMAKIELKEKLDLDGLEMDIVRKQEWEQIFNECWRHMRDFFYDPGMHGADWGQIREKYAPLVKYVNHRADLTYIIGEMVGELNVGHAYVGGGDKPEPERIKTGLLGARLVRDRSSGYYRIEKILKGQNWDKSTRSPLTGVGLDVNEGDYILAVDGVPVKNMQSIYQALVNKVDKQVVLTVNTKAEQKDSRDITVLPIGDEHKLYYYNWVMGNVEKVNKATDGKVGYIHVPDMGRPGLVEFVKYFYPQMRKKGLIIDVRGNGGGNVSPHLIERLNRQMDMIGIGRNTTPSPDPGAVHIGPKVCLIDQFSASDGDIFPFRFKKQDLGPLIGKRTWGGTVGIRGSLPLLDGGYLYKPEFAHYDTKGKEWVAEGVGIEPDIEVDNHPAKEYAGIDQQLNKAIEVILKQLETSEPDLPPVPEYPEKAKKR